MTWLMEILRIYLEKQNKINKILRDKAFSIAKDEYQQKPASMVYQFFDKKAVSLADTILSNEE